MASKSSQTIGEENAGAGVSVPQKEIGNSKVPYEVLRLIPEESAEHYGFVPLSLSDGVLDIGILDPDNIAAIDALNFITRKTGMPFKLFRVTNEDFKKVLGMYRGLGSEVDQALSDLSAESAGKEHKKIEEVDITAPPVLDLSVEAPKPQPPAGGGAGLDIQEDAPAIKLASTILRYAIDGGASDVHIEPTEAGVRVRYRVDGTLHTSVVLPINTHRALVARIKVLSSIRLDEQRKPQDGRFSAEIDGRKIDFRVSTFPSYFGEKVVIRILDVNHGFIPLNDIGLSPRDLELVRNAINQPHGLILISGPTGSGKSTTLYSMVSELDREKHNVLSLEDPIEYHIQGVTQSQVRPEIDYTFANGLRTTLRQDPDIIMVGEIRDGETAKLAIQAALTGHLVFSTIHTNSAVGTIPRLIDMGVEPYLIAPTLVLSMAQRLVQKLCPDGGEEVPVTDSMRNMITEQFSTLPEKYRPEIPQTVREAKRTPACPNGTRGRLAVFEAFAMTPDVEQVVLNKPIDSELWSVLRKQGMLSMKEDAMLKAFDKKIPFSEANALSGLLLSEEEEEQPAPAK